MQTLQEILQQPELENKLLNQAKTVGFVTAMACCPNVLPLKNGSPSYGVEKRLHLFDPIQLENYFEHIIALWNETRSQLLEGNWQWPTGYLLDEAEIVNQEVRDFCEGCYKVGN